MDVIYHLESRQIHELYELYQKEWWSNGRTFEETRTSVRRSQLNIGLVNKQAALVGYARVLTDYVFKALIFDVIVVNRSRKAGFGDKLISLILDHPHLKEVKHFELYCRPEMFPFYERHGFSADVGATRLMRLALR